MKKISFAKDILPHLIAVTIFLVVTVSFFSPLFFDSKVIDQGDIVQWEASAQELIEYRDATGNEGLWTNSIFSGMPAYFISVKWGNHALLAMDYIMGFGLKRPASIFFTAMISAYIMLLCFGVRPYLSIIGAVCFAFSSYNIIGMVAGHVARIHTVAYMPLVIGGVHLCFRKNTWLGFSLTAIGLALQLRPNHVQITYYLALIIIPYMIVQLVTHISKKELSKYLKKTSLLFIAVILAVGTFFGKFYSAYEFSKYSNRGPSELSEESDKSVEKEGISKTYAFQYSNGLSDPLTLFIPNFLGGNQPLPEDSELIESLRQRGADRAVIQQFRQGVPTYWGSESPVTYYLGAIMIFLIVLAGFVVERKLFIWLAITGILGILLSYGRNLEWFNYFLFDYLPGYNKFRSVTFTIIITLLSWNLLAMLALEKVMLTKGFKSLKKPLLVSFGATAGTAIFFVLISGSFSFKSPIDGQLQDFMVSAVRSDRQSLLIQDSLRSALFIALFLTVIYLIKTEKVKGFLKYALIVVLPCMDVILIGSRFISDSNYISSRKSTYFVMDEADRQIEKQYKPGDRVFDLTTQFYSAIRSYNYPTINGYNAVRLKRYQEIIDNALLEENSILVQSIRSGAPDFSSLPVLNMLNTKFFVINPNDPNGVITNNQALGTAWFVEEVIQVDNANQELNTTLDANLSKQAVINKNKFSIEIGSNLSPNGTIDLVEYRPGFWKYQSRNDNDGFGVFSEIYYPKDFEVKIDNQDAEMINVNYVLRGLKIPAGEHTITFEFKPSIYYIGKPIMSGSSIIIILLLGATVYFSLRKTPPNWFNSVS